MAEVRKHGAHWRVRWKHDGTREWIPLPERVATEAEAKREGARVLAILRAGAARRKTDVTSPEGEPLAAWAERWFEDRERRGLVSVRVDRQRLARWVWPVFGAVPLPRLTRAELERLVSALDEHVRERRMRWKTAANIWGLVTKMCSDACGSKLAALRVRPDDPARDVRGPDRGEPRELAYLYPDEAVKLLACPKVPPRWAALYALPMYLALRIGEVAALEASDVNLDASVVTVARSIDGRGRVTSPKNGRSRRVPIHPNARPLLEALVAEAPGSRISTISSVRLVTCLRALASSLVEAAVVVAEGVDQVPHAENRCRRRSASNFRKLSPDVSVSCGLPGTKPVKPARARDANRVLHR